MESNNNDFIMVIIDWYRVACIALYLYLTKIVISEWLWALALIRLKH